MTILSRLSNSLKPLSFNRVHGFIIGVISIITLNNGIAQQFSDNGTFTVDYTKGCTPLTVNIVSQEAACPCDATCPCDVWQDLDNAPNTIVQNGLNQTYSSPGTYTLQVQLQGYPKDRIQIEVVENTVPDFSLTTCTSFQVDVEINDSNFDTYVIDYNDGTVVTVNQGQFVPTYAYASTGTNTVNVRGVNLNAADNCQTNNSQTVEILPALQDATLNSLQLINVTEFDLNYDAQPNTIYHLQLSVNGNNNFQRYQTENEIESGQNTLTIDDSNLDFERNYYCFRLATFDKCSNTYTGYSNSLCSVDLNNIDVLNNELELNWNTSTSGIQNYELSKNENANYTSTTSQSFIDSNNILCNQEYCYQITANYSTGGTSISLLKCATAASTDIPTALEDVNIDVSDPNINLEWETPSDFTPVEYRLQKVDSLNAPDSLSTNSYTHINVNQSCYVIDYTDECLNKSTPTNEICSIYLSYTSSGGIVKLNWNAYQGWSQGVSEYLIIIEGSSGSSTIAAGNSTSYELPEETATDQLIRAYVRAIPNNSALNPVNSNVIEIINSAHIQFPNAFKPEGVTPTFNVSGRYIITVDVKIYTRWGETIAHITNENEGWDGTINGKEAPGGTYIYRAEITDEVGNLHQRTGTVLLIRD